MKPVSLPACLPPSTCGLRATRALKRTSPTAYSVRSCVCSVCCSLATTHPKSSQLSLSLLSASYLSLSPSLPPFHQATYSVGYLSLSLKDPAVKVTHFTAGQHTHSLSLSLSVSLMSLVVLLITLALTHTQTIGPDLFFLDFFPQRIWIVLLYLFVSLSRSLSCAWAWM